MRSGGFSAMGYLYRAIIGAATIGAMSLTSTHAQGSSAACKLLQPSEIESAIGGKATGFYGSALGEASICRGQVGTSKVMMRVVQRKRNDEGEREKAVVAKRRTEGWGIDDR